MPRTIAIALLAIAAFAVFSLATGATYLEAVLPGGLPFGNALTALGLCAAAGTALGLSARGTVRRAVSLIALTAAAAWLPVSVALAGNLALNFSNGRGFTWMVLCFAVVGIVLGALIWTLAMTLLAVRRRTGAA